MGVPILRIIVFEGLHWVPLILGNYHFHMAGGKAAQAGYVKMIGPLLGSPWDDDSCGYRNGGPQFRELSMLLHPNRKH